MRTTSSFFQLTDRNLVLTGYIEPNKPRIGREIASRLKRRFINVEERIEERLGMNLERIRSEYGARRLKTVEAEIMDEVLLYRDTVIRVNGSTLMHGEHYTRIQQTSAVVCLVARLDEILRRMHLMLGARYHNPAERGAQLGSLRREWEVRKMPDLIELDVTYKNEAEIIEAVLELWQEVGISRA